ncbi:MAG: NlpC/P60 family protein [Paracoccaceae bacterium]
MSDAGDLAVTEARLWIGTPYRHQASVRGSGADCLGLVRGVWRRLYGGEPEAVPAYTPDWAEPQGDETLWQAALRHLLPVQPDAASPGDVVLFRLRDAGVAKHLGILSAVSAEGARAFVHAYSGHGVIESPLSAPWARRVVAVFAFPERAI